MAIPSSSNEWSGGRGDPKISLVEMAEHFYDAAYRINYENENGDILYALLSEEEEIVFKIYPGSGIPLTIGMIISDLN